MFDASAARPRFFLLSKLVASALALTALAGCAEKQPRYYSGATGGKEYFAEGKYGKASPRVVQMGEAVPKGGGRYLIGRPYRIAGRTYVPSEKQAGYSVTGTASWYGAAFHGRRTANGEIYDMASITAAHPTMPLPSYARVTNLRNGKSIVVRVNDRGPYHGGRVMDMSSRVADLLDFKSAGTARVKVDYLGKAGIGGSDDRQLAATLTTGAPAQLAGYETPAETTVAAADPAPPPPRPQPARPVPAPPPAPARAASEEEAQAAVEPAPSAAVAPAPATAPKPRPAAASKPKVLDAEADAAPPTDADPAITAQDVSEPLPEVAPTPPRRPDFASEEETPAPTSTRRRAQPQKSDEQTPAPRGRRATRGEASTAALYYAPDAGLATRFVAPGQPFWRWRDVAGESGR